MLRQPPKHLQKLVLPILYHNMFKLKVFCLCSLFPTSSFTVHLVPTTRWWDYSPSPTQDRNLLNEHLKLEQPSQSPCNLGVNTCSRFRLFSTLVTLLRLSTSSIDCLSVVRCVFLPAGYVEDVLALRFELNSFLLSRYGNFANPASVVRSSRGVFFSPLLC